MDNTTQPLFRQIAVLIEDSIIEGALAEGEQVPSTNELAAFHSINPATARKGLALLVATGIVEKRRGVGTFVLAGARDRIRARRCDEFAAVYIAPLVDEAVRLDFNQEQLQDLIRRVAESRGLYR